MDEVTAADEVLLVEVILHPHVLHIHLAIGIAHIDLAFPLAVAEANADAHIGDADAALQVALLMLGVDVGRVHQDTSRRLGRELRLLLRLCHGGQ